jgi:hypothetical protein
MLLFALSNPSITPELRTVLILLTTGHVFPSGCYMQPCSSIRFTFHITSIINCSYFLACETLPSINMFYLLSTNMFFFWKKKCRGVPQWPLPIQLWAPWLSTNMCFLFFYLWFAAHMLHATNCGSLHCYCDIVDPSVEQLEGKVLGSFHSKN